MKLPIALTIMTLIAASCDAFTAPAKAFVRTSQHQSVPQVGPLHAYVPDGLTLEQYKKIKAQEQEKLKGKDLARLGPRGFKSRSMEAWQKAYEKGEAAHAFAPFNYKDKLQKGQIKQTDVPYMVRGGSWDNSDVRGGRKLKWLKEDRDYAKGGYKKEQSVSILGSGPGLDWTGTRERTEGSKKLVPGFS